MSEAEPRGAYVYQPDPPRADGRMYGVGGVDIYATLKGLTKTEATACAAAINLLSWMGRTARDPSRDPGVGEKSPSRFTQHAE